MKGYVEGMAVFDNRHSRRVALLKWLLPLAALVILSTMFLVADRRGTGDSVPFSSVELDQALSDQRIAGPNFTTVTDDGSALIVSARDVTPGGDGPARASDLIVVLDNMSGGRLDLSSNSGTLEMGTGRARLDGGVSLRSTTGYRLEGIAFDVDRDSASIVSDGAVQGTGPPGTLEAGQLSVTREDRDYVLNFTDGVKLVYDPEGNGEEGSE